MLRLILVALALVSLSGCAATTVIVEQRPGHHHPTIRAEFRLSQ